MPSKPTTRILLALLFCSVVILPVTASAARSYRVDLVVFTQPQTADTEQWKDAPPPLPPALMTRAISPEELMNDVDLAAVTGQTEETEEKEVNFADVLARLRKDPRRKVLLATSWVQIVDAPDASPILRITSEPGTAATPPMQPAATGPYAMETPSLTPLPPLLDGFVRFYLSGIYTLELDIRYTPEVPFLEREDPDEPQYTTYRIHEKRRMKSDELNYYDHPKFGVLLLVNPAVGIPEEQP